jgi:hypothetical protein
MPINIMNLLKQIADWSDNVKILFHITEIHQAAKETVALAEQRFLSKQHEWQFDNAWQEMLNHATIKVWNFSWLVTKL